MSAANPTPASTVVLLRQQPDGLAVLLLRRHTEAAFMGGAHVFPGGRVEESDGVDAHALVAGESEGMDHPAGAEPDLGFYIAAIRETFEEAGLLLARDAGGELISFPQNDFD